ncbi:hypothetical protein K438DRAFT_1976526 [Mycena galopus ATCC 62051]|nr:hypothetical protein K438DRAFT_1976526 [Mycena galopus ATCC 62051]
MRKLFHDLFVREGYQYDYVFDWSVQRGAQDDGSADTSKTAGGGCWQGQRFSLSRETEEGRSPGYHDIPRPSCTQDKTHAHSAFARNRYWGR